MHIRIREAEEKDIPQIVNLGKELFKMHAKFDKEYYSLVNNFYEFFSLWVKNYLSQKSQFIIVAEKNQGLVIGFIAGFIKSLYPWFQIKNVGHISFMIIDKLFRKKGVGKLLEKQAELWFKQRGINYIELYVEEDNKIGQEAWSTYGFLPFKKFLRKKI